MQHLLPESSKVVIIFVIQIKKITNLFYVHAKGMPADIFVVGKKLKKRTRDLYFQSIEPVADNSKWILCVNRSFNKFQTRKTLKTNSRDTESKGKCPNQTFIAKILNEKKQDT